MHSVLKRVESKEWKIPSEYLRNSTGRQIVYTYNCHIREREDGSHPNKEDISIDTSDTKVFLEEEQFKVLCIWSIFLTWFQSSNTVGNEFSRYIGWYINEWVFFKKWIIREGLWQFQHGKFQIYDFLNLFAY